MNEKLMSVEDLSEYLQVPVSSIYGWNSKHTGPRYLKLGKHIRYRQSDVEAWLEGGGTDAIHQW